MLAGVSDYCDPTQINLPAESPPFPVPDVLIHCTTARAAKIWPFHNWKIVLDYISSRGWSVGLVGSPPHHQVDSYNSGNGEELLLQQTSLIDLRGQTTLLQLAGACKKARAFVSVDAGPLHIAAAMGTPTLAVVGNDLHGVGPSPIRLWMPRCGNVQRTQSSFSCSTCADERYSNDACLLEGHPCMESVYPEQVTSWLEKTMSLS